MAEALSDTTPREPFAVEAAKPGVRLSPLRSVYVTAILAIITMLSIADKSVLSVLLVPIKKDLHVSDAAMGALTGISFTLVYATVALPMARLADTGVRRNIIAGAVAVWSVMTAVCGLASNYAILLVARMGVAAGEASAAPSSTSMVSDLFSFKRRGTALGFITLGSALGTALGAVVAGQITARYNWHVAFMVLGAPGLAIAVLFLLTVPEPTRGGHDGGERHNVAFASWWRTVVYLARIPSFWPLILANTFVVLSFTGFTAWMPTYLMRVMGLSMGHMSALWGVVTSPAIVGVVLGGFLSDRMAARGARWRVYFMAFLLVLGVPVFATLLATNDIKVVIAMMLIYALVIGPVASIIIAANLDVVRPRARGMMTGIIGLCSSVLGAGFGPVLIGRLNDVVNHTYGDQSLRHTLVAVPIFLMIASLALLWASINTDRDAAAARTGGPTEDTVAG